MTDDASAPPRATNDSLSVDALVLKRAGLTTALVGVVGIAIGAASSGASGALGGV